MANKKCIINPALYKVIFYVLYVLASFFVYYGTYIFFPIISHYGRLVQTILPVTLVCSIPLFLLIMFRRWYNAVGNKMKWKIALGADITVLVISLYSFVSCLIKFIMTKKVTGVTTPLYPLDMVIIDVILLAIALVGLYFILKKRDYLKENQPEQPVKRSTNILAGFYLAFAAFWFGEILHSPILFMGADADPNLPWIIANFFAMSLPTIGLVLFEIYHSLKPANKRVGWIILLSVFSLLTIAFFVWVFVGLAVNSYVYAQSMQPMFVVGYFICFPIGIFFVLADAAITIIVSSVLFFKNSRR